MKDTIDERLKLLATAQECMVDVAITIEQWENSQSVLEKSTFDAMNVTDRALNLSKEGKRMISKLSDCYRNSSDQILHNGTEEMALLLNEATLLFRTILDTAYRANEIAHNLEREVESHREIAEHMKSSVEFIGKSVDQAVACAEFLQAELK